MVQVLSALICVKGCSGENYKVRVLDDLSVGTRENIPSECEFIEGTILDQAVVNSAVQGVTHICHQAARVTIRGSVEKFYEDAETNLMGTLLLAEECGQSWSSAFCVCIFHGCLCRFATTCSDS